MHKLTSTVLGIAATCLVIASGSVSQAQSYVIDKSMQGGGDCVAAGGTWSQPKTCSFSNTTLGPRFATVTVQPSTVVEVLNFVVLQVSMLSNFGEVRVDSAASLLNNGLLRNEAGGEIFIDGNMDVNRDPVENDGTFTVNGLVSLNAAGILNRSGGQVVNNGTILSSTNWTNHGTITNNASGTVSHGGTTTGNALNNYGLIANAGLINNLASLVNFCSGAVTGTPVAGNPVLSGVALEAVDKTGFSWCEPAGGSPYHVLTGNLHALSTFDGDLDGAAVECAAAVAGPPAAHGVEDDLFFLVRPDDDGSWDSDGRFQAHDRNVACPSCNCCEGGDGLGCDLLDCETLVCAADSFCCNDEWDDICDVTAARLCSCCDPGPPDMYEPNDNAGAATKINCPVFQPIEAKIWLVAADVDYFQLQGVPGTLVSIDVDADEVGSTLDPYMGAFDTSLTELGISDDDPAPGESLSLDSYLEVEMPINGVLYIAVTSFEDTDFNGGEDHVSFGPYTLNIQCQ